MGKYETAKSILSDPHVQEDGTWVCDAINRCSHCYRKKKDECVSLQWEEVKKYFERKIVEHDSRKSWKRRAASWIMEARQYIPKDIALNLDWFDLVFEYEKKKARPTIEM